MAGNALGLFFDPIHHVSDHDDAARYDHRCRRDRSGKHQQFGTSLIDASSESADLMCFESHAAVGAAFFVVVSRGFGQIDATGQYGGKGQNG